MAGRPCPCLHVFITYDARLRLSPRTASSYVTIITPSRVKWPGRMLACPGQCRAAAVATPKSTPSLARSPGLHRFDVRCRCRILSPASCTSACMYGQEAWMHGVHALRDVELIVGPQNVVSSERLVREFRYLGTGLVLRSFRVAPFERFG